jgi:hypothetical protein
MTSPSPFPSPLFGGYSAFGGLNMGTAPSITIPPGDPEALHAGARVYAAAANEASVFARRVQSTQQAVYGSTWLGIGALAYTSTSDEAAAWLDNASQALSLAASALTTYAIELHDAQQTAQAARTAAADLNTAASHLAAQVSATPGEGFGVLSPTHAHAAAAIADGRSKAAAMGSGATQMAHAAATKATGAFSHVASMTMAGRVAAAKAAREAAEKKQSHHSMWGWVAVGGLGLVDLGLTAVNAVQLGADPLTDGAEVATVSATAGLATDLTADAATEMAAGDFTAVAADEVESDIAVTASKPDWLVRMQEGNDFDDVQGLKYEEAGGYNEVYVDKPPDLVTDSSKYVRVDSYLHDDEIVSRKMTQLGEVNESTGKGYVRELYEKYQPGRMIADVPSAPPGLAGRALSGDMVLEVPVQTSPVPQSLLDLAKQLNIMIRDINGTVYGG